MQIPPRLLLAAATIALGASSPLARQTAVGARPVHDFVFYDYVEGGVLRGGYVLVDPDDPLLGGETGPIARSRAPFTTVISNGDPANRVDLVLVGDGYTASELGAYAQHVSNVLPAFFSEHPLDKYASYFNVHRVDVVSIDSGVDNDPVQGVQKNTALDMSYWCSGIQRLLCVNTGKAYSFARSAPDVDQVLALANSTTYGGAGYPANNLGTLAGANGSAIEVALHEFGHSFADLADEYTYGGPTTWAGGEPAAPNVSTLDATAMAAQSKKWYRWLSEPNVGTFEGANYSVYGIYRPTNNSLMRNLNRPLEQVNVEQFILSLYETVRPIDAATSGGVHATTDSFFVVPMQPLSHNLDVQWYLDGTPIAGATGNTLDASTLGLGPGPYQLSVEVVDNTPWVRDETRRTALMRQVKAWTLDDNPQVLFYGCGLNPAGSLTVLSGSPRIGTTLVFGVDNPVGTSSAGALPIVAVSLSPDPNYPCGTQLLGFAMNPFLAAELLVDLSPGSFLSPFLLGAPYGGAGSGPAPVSLTVPNDPALLGTSLFVQGAHFDPTGSFGVRIGLAEAAELRIGQ